MYTQQWFMSYKISDSLRAGTGRKQYVHIPLLCLQRKTPDDGQKNSPKHVGFYSTSKFEKWMHLIGFIK